MTYLTNDEIIHPIRTSSQRNAIRAIRKRPDLSDDDPRARTPTISEMHDEEPDHDDRCPACCFVLGPRVSVTCDDGGDDDVAAGHADRSDCQNGLASDAIDVKNCWDGGDEHDDTDYTCRKEGDCVAG